jgi:predicted transcriptional regulator
MKSARKVQNEDVDSTKAVIIGRGLHAKRGVRITLRGMREAQGKTQTEIARALETDQGEISRIEGRADVKLSTLRKYAAAIGAKCEVAFVFSKTGHRIIVADPES